MPRDGSVQHALVRLCNANKHVAQCRRSVVGFLPRFLGVEDLQVESPHDLCYIIPVSVVSSTSWGASSARSLDDY